MSELVRRPLQPFLPKLADALHVNLRFRDPSGEVDEVRTLRLLRDPLG